MDKLVIQMEGDDFVFRLRDAKHIGVCWNDKKVLVTGVGHSGTNLLLEIVRASESYNVVLSQEDRFFSAAITMLFMYNYGAKLACDSPTFSTEAFVINMTKFPSLQVLVVIRNPIDAALSGAYRGLPLDQGGDSLYELDPIYTYDESHARMIINNWQNDYAPKIYGIINKYGPEGRAMLFKMEDIITQPKVVATDIASWLAIPYNDNMATPWKFNTHREQKKRYAGKLDTSQIDNYKRWDTIYDGFYADKKEFVYTLSEGLKPVATLFDYETELPE